MGSSTSARWELPCRNKAGGSGLRVGVSRQMTRSVIPIPPGCTVFFGLTADPPALGFRAGQIARAHILFASVAIDDQGPAPAAMRGANVLIHNQTYTFSSMQGQVFTTFTSSLAQSEKTSRLLGSLRSVVRRTLPVAAGSPHGVHFKPSIPAFTRDHGGDAVCTGRPVVTVPPPALVTQPGGLLRRFDGPTKTSSNGRPSDGG